MTLHLSHMGFTEGLTFIINSFFSPVSSSEKESGAYILVKYPARLEAVYDLLRQVILPLVKSYGLISSFTESPSMMRI